MLILVLRSSACKSHIIIDKPLVHTEYITTAINLFVAVWVTNAYHAYGITRFLDFAQYYSIKYNFSGAGSTSVFVHTRGPLESLLILIRCSLQTRLRMEAGPTPEKLFVLSNTGWWTKYKCLQMLSEVQHFQFTYYAASFVLCFLITYCAHCNIEVYFKIE